MDSQKIYGLVGEKLVHSFSKKIHNLLGNENYELYPFSKEQFNLFISKKEFSGLNITIPYKKDIIPFCDYFCERAEKIGAVNTVCNKNGKLFGYNTDYDGFKYLITKNKIEIKDKIVVILGTGGTSLTAKCVVNDLGAKEVFRVSRNQNNFNDVISYENLDQIKEKVEVLINTTPIGMYPKTFDVPVDILSDINRFISLRAVVDVIYNPLNTKLILKAKERNLQTATGLSMLVAQAFFAHKLFFNETQSNIENTIEKIEKIILKEKINICLIGMPGCGKSAIAEILSQKLNMKFIDCDKEIEKDENCSIPNIFLQKGEEYFRTLEFEKIKKLCLENNLIISTGGGVIKNLKNIENLKLNSIIIFIDRPLENLCFDSSRPLSSTFEDLKTLYNERYSVYNRVCDKKITNNTTLGQVANDIIAYCGF
ncbi:MAG: shikimate kinase [Oscillospiraceae bacterium]